MKVTSLFFVFICLITPLTAQKGVADPFDPNREAIFDAPANQVQGSANKALVDAFEPSRAALVARDELKRIAEKAGAHVVSSTSRRHTPFGEDAFLLELNIGLTIRADLTNTMAFFDLLDDHSNSFRIHRLNMEVSRKSMPPPQPDENGALPRPPALHGSVLETQMTLMLLSFRGDEEPDWPFNPKGHGVTGVVNNVIYHAAKALPYTAHLTLIKLRGNKLTLQGRTQIGDSVQLSSLLEEFPFVAEPRSSRPNTRGSRVDESLFACQGLIVAD